jgi:hypothetical protein
MTSSRLDTRIVNGASMTEVLPKLNRLMESPTIVHASSRSPFRSNEDRRGREHVFVFYPDTNGFPVRSRLIVVSGPWPQMTLVSSGRV